MDFSFIIIDIKKLGYKEKLEKVLENKVYSLNTKNLLLNMFYEIENSYADYEEAKRQVPLKKDFIQYLINTIQKKCTEIEIIKNNSQKGQKLQDNEHGYIIENNKIIALENDKILLEAILEISRNEIKIPIQYQYVIITVNTFLEDNKLTEILKK